MEIFRKRNNPMTKYRHQVMKVPRGKTEQGKRIKNDGDGISKEVKFGQIWE